MSTLQVPSSPQAESVGLPSVQAFRQAQGPEFNRWAQADGSWLTLHFDRLSVLSVPKEAGLSHPAFKDGASAVSSAER